MFSPDRAATKLICSRPRSARSLVPMSFTDLGATGVLFRQTLKWRVQRAMAQSYAVMALVASIVMFVSLMVVSSIAIGFATMLLTATTKTTIPPSSVTVSIHNFAFSPQNISVTGNTTVTWTNNDTVHHTVTTLAGMV